MQNVIETELTEDLSEALREKIAESSELLALTASESPKEVVGMIRQKIDQLLEEGHSSDDLFEYSLQLGALFGQMLEKAYSWSWKHLDFGNDVKGIYLVSPQSYYCCPPLFFINKILMGNNTGLDGRNDNTALLLFNMMEDIESKQPEQHYQVLV